MKKTEKFDYDHFNYAEVKGLIKKNSKKSVASIIVIIICAICATVLALALSFGGQNAGLAGGKSPIYRLAEDFSKFIQVDVGTSFDIILYTWIAICVILVVIAIVACIKAKKKILNTKWVDEPTQEELAKKAIEHEAKNRRGDILLTSVDVFRTLYERKGENAYRNTDYDRKELTFPEDVQE